MRRRGSILTFGVVAVTCLVGVALGDDGKADAEPEFGWLSVLPPLVAIVLAMLTRRVVVSLLLGIFVGALVAAQWNPLTAVYSTIENHVWGSFSDESALRIIAFTLMMGAMVGVISRNGSMTAMVNGIAGWARGRRGGQLVTWFLGLFIFFDDYANSVIIGNTMRPVTDRLRISREKLAYIIDSTAAPVAGLALISTWIAVELKFIDQGLNKAGLSADGYKVFIYSIPYRLYVIWALLMVPTVAWLGRDFGRMRAAEERAFRDGGRAQMDGSDVDVDDAAKGHWLGALIPVGTVVGVFCAILFAKGYKTDGISYLAMFYGALAGLVVSVLLTVLQKQLARKDLGQAMFSGEGTMAPALVILVLAWGLQDVTKGLGFGDTLRQLIGDDDQSAIVAAWFPAIVFVVAGFTSFAIGSSWATMGILVPVVIPLAAGMIGEDVTAQSPLLITTVGSVLAGAIFGDHCSPISDTTVLSSQAAGCDHVAHVATQLPYAMLVGVISVVGLVGIGFGVPVWLVLPVGMIGIVGFVYVVGKPVQASEGE